jgi:hypothetical protein
MSAGRISLLVRCRLPALLMGAVVLLCVTDASAKSRKWRNYNSYNSFEQMNRDAQRNMQAEWERQRKEQEQAQRRAMREADEAQREAERSARRTQAEMERQQWRGQDGPQGRQNDRYRQDPRRQTDQAKNQDDQDQDAKGRRSDRNDQRDEDIDDGFADDGFDDNPQLRAAERRVRAIERMRLDAIAKAQKDQEELRNREKWRPDQWRPRDDKPDSKDAPRRDESKDRDTEQAYATSDETQSEKPERRLNWADVRASGLGMGRNAVKGQERETRDDDKRDAADDASSDKSSPENARNDGNDGRKPGRGDVLGKVAAGGTVFPGMESGAEMPPEMFVKERQTELLVTDLSPEHVEAAKLKGFVVGAPTALGNTGTSVQRLSVPGYSQDEAERELHKAFPFLSVTPNRAYNIFIGSLGESEGAAGLSPGIDRKKVSPASSQPCPNNTCFGGTLIKWKPELTSCAKSVRIGVIDTSFDTNHPTFRGLNAERAEFLDGKPPSPYDWHGTAVLSLLAGDPKSGTPGLVPEATYLLASAFRSDAAGNASTDTARLLAALAWLEERDVDIVNMSFSGPRDPAFARAIERMSKKGIVFTAAAGNMGPTASPSYPAAYPSVIAVTAVNSKGENYRQANRGTYINVSAPGVDILTALPQAKQGYRTGTSFAAPFVTAILATGSVHGANAAKPQLLKQMALHDLGPPGNDPIFGAGLALAPARCVEDGGAVANKNEPPSAIEAWSAQTKLIRASTAGAAQ